MCAVCTVAYTVPAKQISFMWDGRPACNIKTIYSMSICVSPQALQQAGRFEWDYVPHAFGFRHSSLQDYASRVFGILQMYWLFIAHVAYTFMKNMKSLSR